MNWDSTIPIVMLLIFLMIALYIGQSDNTKGIPAHHHSIINTEKMKCEIDELPREVCLAQLEKRIYRPTIAEMDDNPDYNRW